MVSGYITRQLVWDVEFERVRDERKAKELAMTDAPEDAGHGALFKNDRKEKPAHPDYRGDATLTIRGLGPQKLRISAWLKDGRKGKYMSLAFRLADEEVVKPAAKAAAYAPVEDDSIPF
jgi:hypothetical protein